MTKNTKIALGCGGAGCLGLILLVIVGVVLVVSGVVKAPGLYNPDRSSNYNYNYNSNRNSNFNANTNLNSNTNSTNSSSTMSDDDKHKLFQAAGITRDNQLIIKVLAKIGFPTGSGEEFKKFTSEHFAWATKNYAFIQSVITTEKARAYVEAHLDD